VSTSPWEPPLAGSEVEHLVGALNRLRATFRWKAADLDAAGLSFRLPGVSLTLGGLLKHLSSVEHYTFTVKVDGQAQDEPWRSLDPSLADDWDFTSAAHNSPEELCDLYDRSVARSRRRLDDLLSDGGLDQLVHAAHGNDHASLRRLVVDLIEEYGRHTGHADLLREALDGRVGEDPTPDFVWPKEVEGN